MCCPSVATAVAGHPRPLPVPPKLSPRSLSTEDEPCAGSLGTSLRAELHPPARLQPQAQGPAEAGGDSGQNKPAANIRGMWTPGGEGLLPSKRGEGMKLGRGIINPSETLSSLPGPGSAWGENSHSGHK